mmetsp:Transcript_30843/g.45976  ORF Transcript_30843/g.45976 Transcript_30843/m.45976 type:complete len:85 (+) Transcript_30843:559-813(+)
MALLTSSRALSREDGSLRENGFDKIVTTSVKSSGKNQRCFGDACNHARLLRRVTVDGSSLARPIRQAHRLCLTFLRPSRKANGS